MSKPKLTDTQILMAINKLNLDVLEEFRARGFGDNFNPGHRREVIQETVCALFNVEYTDSGFRNRLGRMVDLGTLRKFRLGEHITYYKIKTRHSVKSNG